MTSTKSLAGLLADLVSLAVDVINHERPCPRLPAVVDMTDAFEAKRGHVIGAEVWRLLECLCEIETARAERNVDRADEWCVPAGAFLVMVRRLCVEAIRAEAVARPETTDHDYRGGHV
jgi:hypothetical protein